MKRIALVLTSLLLALVPLQAQKTADAETSTFGLDEKDAASVREIRRRMAQIRKTRPTVALVLSGGGAKGAATAGALKYLEQYDFPIDMVVGTSIGGMMGAMYAMGYKADYLDSLFRHMDWSVALSDKVDKAYVPYSRIRYKEKYLFSFPFYYNPDDYKNFIRGDMPFAAGRSREIHLGADEGEDFSSLARSNLMGSLPSGFVFGQNVNQIITSRTVGYSDSTDFFKLPIPFACVATDIASGRAKIWHSGSLPLAMRSTMSIPGLFAPVRTEGMVLVDGGMRNNFPVNVAREMGADIVIGIDLSDANSTANEIQNLGDIVMSSIGLFDDTFNKNAQNADVRIHPDLKGYGMLSFNRTAVDTMCLRGYRAAVEKKPQLDSLRRLLGKARLEYHGKKAIDLEARPVLIKDIEIVGVSDKDADYIRSKMFVKPGSVASKRVIEEDIASIFGKGAYDYVTYELRGTEEPFRLRILCKRGPMHQIGFGARMDTEDIVSLLLNVGLNTNALRGHSLDMSARISMNPYVDLRYSYNAPRFSTFNVRATLSYAGSSSFLARQEGYLNASMLHSAQEIYFSNMQWSSFDVRLGIRNQYFNTYTVTSATESGVDYTVRPGENFNFPGVFADGRVETMDDGYFPTRGVSAGIQAELTTDVLLKGVQTPVLYGIIGADGMFPFSFGNLTFIPQFAARFVMGNEPPFVLYNMIGGDMRGRYIEHQLPFIGLTDTAIMDSHLMMVRLDTRYKVYKNSYLTFSANLAHSSKGFDHLASGRFIPGLGVSFAYDSIAGPLKVQFHWSTITKLPGIYLSFGYNF